MPDPTTPPDPGAQPTQPGRPPADPKVYGGHWGNDGTQSHDKPDLEESDRPSKIVPSPEPQGETNIDDPQV